MPVYQKPWTEAMLAVLADGEWHLREHVAEAGEEHVPAGHAVRKAQARRSTNRRWAGNPEPVQPGNPDDALDVMVGRRYVVNANLSDLLQRGRLEQRVVDQDAVFYDGQWWEQPSVRELRLGRAPGETP